MRSMEDHMFIESGEVLAALTCLVIWIHIRGGEKMKNWNSSGYLDSYRWGREDEELEFIIALKGHISYSIFLEKSHTYSFEFAILGVRPERVCAKKMWQEVKKPPKGFLGCTIFF